MWIGCTFAAKLISNLFQTCRLTSFSVQVCWVPIDLVTALFGGTFERFTTKLSWIARNKLELLCIFHVLDDFIIINSSPTQCVHHLKTFLNM